MENKKMLVDLGIAIALNKPSEKFGIEDMNDAFKKSVADLVGNEDGTINAYKWERNKTFLFEIMSEIISEVEPRKLTDIFNLFAEVRNVPYGQSKRFILKSGINNIKRFVTRVAQSGVYERVRLDRNAVEVKTYAHGGAIWQTFENFLLGIDSLSELLGYFVAAMEEKLYEDVLVAISSFKDRLPAANKVSGSVFDRDAFLGVVNTVSAYGTPTIFTTLAFAQKNLIPAEGWVSDVAREEMRQQGYLGKFYGADVIVLPQSFTDASNTVKVLKENFAYVMPAGSMEKPIKVVLEGPVQIRDEQREDWSFEMQIWRKAGIAIINTNNIGIFETTA